MWLKNKIYTIGKYGEIPEGINSISPLRLLASTLAWAAENSIPFNEAVLSITDAGVPQTKCFDLFRPQSWDAALQQTYFDLTNGHSLGKALRKDMKKFLPLYFIQSVEQAEIDGNLPEALRSLTRNIDYVDKTTSNVANNFKYPALVLIIIILLTLFLSVFIFPKFKRILDELLEGDAPPLIFEFTITLMNYITLPILLLFPLALIIIIIRRIPPLKHFLFRILIEPVAIYLPICGKPLRDLRVLELSAAVSSYLNRGEDIIAAVKYSYKTVDAFWLRMRLRKFIRSTENGTDWLTAWSNMKLGSPMNELIIRNAASSENIIKGFDNLTDWLYHSSAIAFRKMLMILCMLFFAFNVALVFSLQLSVFQSLRQIIEKLSSF